MGLASYVQHRAAGTGPQLPADGFAVRDVRLRAYATGAALAQILERVCAGLEVGGLTEEPWVVSEAGRVRLEAPGLTADLAARLERRGPLLVLRLPADPAP
jgi:hypothetical protein